MKAGCRLLVVLLSWALFSATPSAAASAAERAPSCVAASGARSAPAAPDLLSFCVDSPVGQTERQRWIVRFHAKKLAAEHHAALSAQLPGEGSTWEWVPRHNPATAHPTDFGLVGASNVQLLPLLLAVSGVRDVHPDRRIHQLQSVEGTDAARAAGPNDASEVGDHGAGPVPGGDSAHHELLRVSKRPGRMTTSFLMDASELESPEEQLLAQAVGSGLPSGEGEGAGRATAEATAEGRRQLLMRAASRAWPEPEDAEQQQQHARDRRLLHGHHRRRHIRSSLTTMLGADAIWARGHSGAGIKVGVFDTGIRADHPHIRNIKERTNWTHQDSLSDGLGHGSFVAGVIASQDSQCPGLAPDAELYTFKVFTDDQVEDTA
jgi:subtilisin family serine protease